MIKAKTPRIALLALLCAALVAGCGGDEEPQGDPIPADVVTELNKQLDSVSERFEFGGGACADIQEDSLPQIEELLQQVPSSVNADVRRALNQSFDRLFQLAEQQCDEQKEEPQTDTETIEEPPPTVTIPPETQTQTVPPETQTQPEPEPQPQNPGNNGNGQGNGQQGGNGNGNGNGGNAAPGAGGGAAAPGDDG